MASKPKSVEETTPDVVGQIILLQPEQIDASDRLRPVDPMWAEALAGIMEAEGQHTPIEVCRLPGRSDYRLVTGAHRHAAATLKGLWLRAEVVTSDAAERRLREVSENLHRRDLAPLDRAAFIAELVAVHKARAGIDFEKDGRFISATVRWQKALKDEADDTNVTMTNVYGWAEKTAEQLGFSRAKVERDLYLYRRISPTIIDSLRRRDHPVLRNASQLRALAKLDDVQQSKVHSLLMHADAVIKGAPFATVTEALAALSNKAAPAPEDKRLNAFLGAFSRMSLQEKKGALRHLAEQMPAGWTLSEGGDRG